MNKKNTSTGLSEALKSLYAKKIPSLFRPPNTRYIKTGLRGLDILLGGQHHPGIATGRWYEIIGQEGAGKSTFTYTLINSIINQSKNVKHNLVEDGKVISVPAPRKVLVLDFEHATDLGYLQGAVPNAVFPDLDVNGKIKNVNNANVWLHQPLITEEGGDLMLNFLNTGEFGMVIIDSIPAMCSKEESDKSMCENTVGLQARSIGKLFRKSLAMVSRLGVIVILVNQWRDKIGLSFGDPRITPGGKSIGFYTSVRMDIMGSKKTKWFPDGGKICKIKTLKNKITGVLSDVEYHIQSGYGISGEIELIEALGEAGILKYNSRKQKNKIEISISGGIAGFKDYEELLKWLRCDKSRIGKLWDIWGKL